MKGFGLFLFISGLLGFIEVGITPGIQPLSSWAVGVLIGVGLAMMFAKEKR